MNDPGYEVQFMPWADLGQVYKVGPYSFSPWSSMQIEDQGVRTYLTDYFARHVDHNGKPVNSVAILLKEGCDFRPTVRLPHEHPVAAANVLLFSIVGPTVIAAVSANNRSVSPPTANRFELLQQNFRPADADVLVRSGGSSHVANISKITFPQPWDLGGSACYPCEELLNGLGRLFDPTFSNDIRTRMFRSLEWFRLAHMGDETMSDLSRAVMMATAFEILFQIPDGPGKTQHFISAIESRIVQLSSLSETRQVAIKIGKKKGQLQSVTHTLPGWWADKFYDLRSRIVHGDDVIPEQLRYEGWISHLIVADVVLFQCIKQELFGLGLIGDDLHKMQADPLTKSFASMLEFQFFGYEAHRTLKWIK